ncbi:MAG: hypothetical protein VXY06_01120 [Bacteroidota bacterium]|nr:hypothetical protein [Bacteroidota bacterium]
MKKIILLMLITYSTQVYSQFDKGQWYIGASTNNISFSSSSNSENKLDVVFTGFSDTLVNETDSLNLAFLFPYSYQLDQDKLTEININLKGGYFVADQFMLGLGFGFENESSVFKTNADSKLENASLADSLMGLWFEDLPNVSEDGLNYENHYNELYFLLYASAENDITISKSMISVAPFARYNFKLRKGNAIYLDGSFRYAFGNEEVKSALSSISTTTDYTATTINFGLGFCAFLAGNFTLEPQLNYYLNNTEISTTEETPHPILSYADMGERETKRITSGSGFNFSVGFSYYFK